jgi:hypothetical protein
MALRVHQSLHDARAASAAGSGRAEPGILSFACAVDERPDRERDEWHGIRADVIRRRAAEAVELAGQHLQCWREFLMAARMKCPCGADAERDKQCCRCRLSKFGNAKRKYIWTPELIEELRKVYASKSRPELTKGLAELQKKTGFPRADICKCAGRFGLVKFRNKPWTQKEIHFLAENAGRLSPWTLAAKLGRTFFAVREEMRVLGISAALVPNGYYRRELADLLGCGHQKVAQFVASGWLEENARGFITVRSVREFLRLHPSEYRLAWVKEEWFKALVFPVFEEKVVNTMIKKAVQASAEGAA